MGLWSKIKKAVKKVWRALKAVGRIGLRIFLELVSHLSYGLADLLLGFLSWPPKRLRLHVFILWSEDPGGGDPLTPITQVAQEAIDRTKKLYKDKFNVKILPYSKTFIEVLTEPVPQEVLEFECSLRSEFGVTGEYFAQKLAGWVTGPISVTFPITVFVVREIKGDEVGCSMNAFADYVVIDRQGLSENVALAHEIGHTCTLWHSGTSSNLMYKSSPAGEGVKWFQKNLLRSSRHVLYW